MLRESHELTDAETSAMRRLNELGGAEAGSGPGMGWWHRLCERAEPVPARVCELLVARLDMGEGRHPGRWLEADNSAEALEEAIDGIAYLCMAYALRTDTAPGATIGQRYADPGRLAIGAAISAQIDAAVAIADAIEACEARP